MALIHLRESAAFFDVAKYTQVKENSVSGKLNESVKRVLDREPKREWSEQSLKSLRETFSKAEINPDIISKVLQNLKDGVAQQHKYWRLPVSRYDVKNANNRYYPKRLWQNVQKQKDWVGITGLMDHPNDNDPGSTKDGAIVWLGLELDELDKIVYGIGAFVGFWGSLCEAILEVGGRLGFSSSGFGELEADGMTVDPDSYILERLADVVFNPSQTVYGDMSDEYQNDSNIEYTAQKGIKESAGISQILQHKQETIMENKDNTPKVMSKTEEKMFRKYVEQFMKDADNITNPSARLKEIADIKDMFDSGITPDLKEQVEAKLVEERSNLEKLIEDASNAKAKLGVESLDKLAEGSKVLAAKAITLEEQTTDYKKLVEELTKINQGLRKDNAGLKARLGIRENTMSQSTKMSNTKISALAEAKDTLACQLDNADTQNSKLERQVSALNESNKRLESDLSKAKRNVAELKEAADKAEADKRMAEHSVVQLRLRITKLTEATKAAQKSVAYLTEQNSKVVLQQKDQAKHMAEQDETIRMLSNPQYAQYHEKQDYQDEMTGFVNFREDRGVEINEYWNDLKKNYGNKILPYEDKIRGAKTLAEASMAFLRARDDIDEGFKSAHDARLDEGTLTQEDRRTILKEAGMNVDQPVTEKDVNDTTKNICSKFGLN